MTCSATTSIASSPPRPAAEPPIAARDLRLAFGSRTVLRISDLTIPAGRIVALLGRNGTGKTTLLRAFLGMHRPAGGDLHVLGRDMRKLGPWARLRLRSRIGYVPQAMSGTSDVPLTVREIVAMGRSAVAGPLRRLGRTDRRIVDEWLDRLDIARLADCRFGEISGGEQRKAVIARAMTQQPEMLLLDEPTAYLDLGWREHIVRLLGDLHAGTGLTTVLVCHELEVLPPACREVVLLGEGTVIARGAPEKVLTDRAVSAFYGGSFTVHHHAGRHSVLPGGEAAG